MSIEKNFLNVHALHSHSCSCLNRDDMNMQKSAVFGGVRRVRISSQCLKHSIRESDYYGKRFTKSKRTRIAIDLICEELKQQASSDEERKAVEKCCKNAAKIVAGKKVGKDQKHEGTAQKRKSIHIETQMVPFVEAELAEMKAVIQNAVGVSGDKQSAQLKEGIHEVLSPKGKRFDLDIAVSGRMATWDPKHKVEGAMSVAHAFTTHAVDAEVDWFTAVDDLAADEGEQGAGHMNAQEMSGGVFYRYASINLGKLAENLNESDSDKVLDTSAHLVRLLAMVVPTAKNGSTAPFNPADCVLVSFSDIPISAANAFEAPVRPSKKSSGLRQPSMDALENHYVKTIEAYSIDENRAVFVNDLQTALTPCFAKLADLEQWVRQGGK